MYAARQLTSLALVASLAATLYLCCEAIPVWAQTELKVELAEPTASQAVVGETEVRGTVKGPGFSRYDLHYRPVGVESDYIYFGGGESPVESGVLGYWSGLNLDLGDYEIRLIGHFADQQVFESSVRFSLADEANVGELESAGSDGPGTLSGSQSELRESLDNLVIRSSPMNLWSYLGRGAQISATAGGLALAYFAIKALIIWALRRARTTGE